MIGLFLTVNCHINDKKETISIRERLPDGSFQYVNDIIDTSVNYDIDVEGTLDGWNTAEFAETYDGNYFMQSKFEPNESLVIENMGTTDLVNPRIVINNRRRYYSVKEILSGIVKPGMSDEEKAQAIYAFWSDYETQGHHNSLKPGPPYPEIIAPPSASTFGERADPVKALNSYFAGGCSLISANFVILCRAAGIPARALWMCAPENPNPIVMYGETYRPYATHCVAEAWYNNSWHLFDTDQRNFYRGTDNQNIASYEDLHLNPALVSRTISQGFVSNRKDVYSVYYGKYFPPKEMPVEQWISEMGMTLRPGEKFIWKWNNTGKFRLGNNYRLGKEVPPNLANGKMVYNPQLILSTRNSEIKGYYFEAVGKNEREAKLQPIVKGTKAEVLFTMKVPYPLVGASLSADIFKSGSLDTIRVFYSVLNGSWEKISVKTAPGEQKLLCVLDSLIAPKKRPAIYSLFIKFEMTAQTELHDVWIRNVFIEADVQMNRNALPALSVGRNLIHYSSESKGKARIVHTWKESKATEPPLAPQKPVYPADKQHIRLENLKALRWDSSVDPDQDGIAAYHIQMSYRKDMLLPVSTNLDRFIRQTEPAWAIPEGWLLEGQTYYWRVRAKDRWGAWSGWSNVWQFKVES